MMDIDAFVKERDEALLSLDKRKILRYAEKYGVNLPTSETAFWAGVHKAIFALSSATDEQKEKSYKWLREHGFSPYIA